jgi:ATP-dependent Clp protease protease subunit
MKKLFLLFLLVLSMGYTSFKEKTIKLDESNFLLLRGEVNSDSMSKLTKSILSHPNKEVYVFIDSPGGSVFDGLAFIGAIKGSEKTVTCIVSEAISMAFVILQACDNRYVLPHANLMQHVGSVQVGGQMHEIESFLKHIKNIATEMNQMQADRIGISLEKFEKLIENDWWLTATQAIEENVADQMVNVTCSAELLKATEKTTVRGPFGLTMEVEFSKCPLLSNPIAQ